MALTPKSAHTFEVRTDEIEVTMGGLYGGKPDVYRRFIPGMTHYYVDGVEVDKQTFDRLYAD